MTRPSSLPIFGTALGSRTEPPIGTLSTGWAFGQVVPAKHLSWVTGLPGDWLAHLDERQISMSDVGASDGDASRLTTTGLTFQIGGALVQYPLTGGVYWGRGQRLDASAVGSASGALYTFTPAATNYIWLRYQPLTVRSSYPEHAVTTILAPPGTGYVHVATVTTNLVAVTNVAEPTTVHYGPRWGGASGVTHTFKRPLKVQTDGIGATEAEVVGAAGGAAPVMALNMGASLLSQQTTRPLLALAADTAQTCIEGQSLGGSGNPGVLMLLDDGSVGYKTTTDGAATDQSASLVSETNNLARHWLIVADPTLLPADAAPWTGKFRLGAIGATEAGGLRWYTADSPGLLFLPRASRLALSALPAQQAANQAGAAGFAANLVTCACPLYSGHTYTIRVECEANATAVTVFTQTVTITVNGVAQAPWNAKLHATARIALDTTWLCTTIRYTHAGADALAANIVLAIVHGAGAGNVTYLAPRITVISAVG